MFSSVRRLNATAATAIATAVVAATATVSAASSQHQNHHHSRQYDLTTTAASMPSSDASIGSRFAGLRTVTPPADLRLAFDPTFIQAAALTVDDEEFNQLSGDPNWWQNAIEEDSFDSPLPFDASESGLWNGRFVPPPPRPPFLDEATSTDGLTTCDLCTWAWHDRNTFSLDASIGGELYDFYSVSAF